MRVISTQRGIDIPYDKYVLLVEGKMILPFDDVDYIVDGNPKPDDKWSLIAYGEMSRSLGEFDSEDEALDVMLRIARYYVTGAKMVVIEEIVEQMDWVKEK